MLDKKDKELVKKALNSLSKSKNLKGGDFATVGCALITSKGNIFTGVCLALDCGIGFCAEHSAAAEMVKNGETQIKKIVAMFKKGNIIPPCGRCRELIYQLDDKNIECEVIISKKEKVKLKDLLPNGWKEDKFWK